MPDAGGNRRTDETRAKLKACTGASVDRSVRRFCKKLPRGCFSGHKNGEIGLWRFYTDIEEHLTHPAAMVRCEEGLISPSVVHGEKLYRTRVDHRDTLY